LNLKAVFLAVLSFTIPAVCGIAADQSGSTTRKPTENHSERKSTEAPSLAHVEEKLSVTRHTLKLEGGDLNYTATAGCLRLKDGSGKPKADLFFVAYTSGEHNETRPITFAFNGGPGASSIWLHMGLAGPVRVFTGEENRPSAPPYPASPNHYSWLPWTDLVFIDPIGTGFSRAIPVENAKQYFNTIEDIHSVGDFIQLYTDKYGRWRSPKYLAGESYGGLRAAGLLPYLYETYGMEMDGLLLISPALDLSAIKPGDSSDLPCALFLPSYVAVAWYHGKIASEFQAGLQETLSEAERWTLEEYLPALAKGNRLPDEVKNRIAAKLARLTGLSESIIKARNLRVSRPEFTAGLLRDEGRTLSFMDGRIARTGRDGGFLEDPAMALTVGPYNAVLREYIRDELDFKPGIPYVFFSEDANSQWEWGSALTEGEMVASIRKTMNRNKRLKILAGAGLFDLDIPYFSAAYIMSHLGTDPSIAPRITLKFFKGGHMFYTNQEALEGFKAEAARFFK
jgi:carboxypeptidase C (cathepsin A)